MVKLEKVVEELKEEIWELDTNNRLIQHGSRIVKKMELVLYMYIVQQQKGETSQPSLSGTTWCSMGSARRRQPVQRLLFEM